MAKPLTDKKKKLILADYLATENRRETARKHGVSEATVRNIIKSSKDTDFAHEFAQKQDEATMSVLQHIEKQGEKKKKVLDAILDGMLDKAENVDMFTNIKDLATAYGIILDKEYKPLELSIKQQESQTYTATPDMEQYAEYKTAQKYFWDFCQLKAPDFYTNDAFYLRELCQAMQEFEYDDNELLVLNLPPRFGKTRTAQLASQWYLGRTGKRKIIGASYNEKLSRRSSKAVRDSIAEKKASKDRTVFSDVFPNVNLARGSTTVDLWRLEGNQEDNYLATSPDATMTGFGADIIIIDDLIKNAYEANHKGILEDHFTWFTDTVVSRMEGMRKLILIMTRWSTKDLSGKVVSMYQEQGRKVRIITKQAYDGKRLLCERILDMAAYKNLEQTIGEDIFQANYNQAPIDLKGRLYGVFTTYTESPPFSAIKAYLDIADKGSDYIACGIYGVTKEHEPNAHMQHVIYTQEDMDKAENDIVQALIDYDVEDLTLEDNFGGRAWKKVLEEKYKIKCTETQATINKRIAQLQTELKTANDRAKAEEEIRQLAQKSNKLFKCIFITFHQKRNKEAKILATASTVTRKIFMPPNWQQRWRKFYADTTEYQRTGNDTHDDAQDMLSEIVLRGLNGAMTFLGL